MMQMTNTIAQLCVGGGVGEVGQTINTSIFNNIYYASVPFKDVKMLFIFSHDCPMQIVSVAMAMIQREDFIFCKSCDVKPACQH